MIKKYKRISKRIIASIMSAVMIAGTLAGVGISNTDTAKAKDYGISNPRINADGSVTWDKIKFGSYKQSVEFEYEPIKWRILSVDENNNALLLADKGLDCKPYNEKGVDKVDEDGDSYTDYSCTWETCTLRNWLNEDFYNEAFTEAEQSEIKQVIVKNDDNSEYGTEGGNDTTDKVYLLSIEEASNSAYGFDSADDTECAAGECKVTEYACMNGARRSSSSRYAGNCDWWLRSPGLNSGWAAFVDYDGGSIVINGYVVIGDDNAIRPALQINLSSSLVTDAGEVASDGTVTDAGDGYNNPKVTDEVTVWDCVYFGRYKQTSSTEKEPIEWRVLSVDGDEALLLADKGLDCKMYNEEGIEKIDEYGISYTDYSCTWETCTLRSWLNDDFYNEAFDEVEKSAIKQVTVKNDDNPSYGTEGGDDTSDKVYLLSIEEASNIAYGFDSTFDKKSTTRECKVTDYASLNSAWRDSVYYYDGNCYWRLRSLGVCSDRAAGVDADGWGDYSGNDANIGSYAIRPALRIILSSSVWEVAGTASTGAGTIDANQQIQIPEATAEPISTPKPTPNQTYTPAITSAPDVTVAPNNSNTQPTDKDAKLKAIKLSSVKCKKNSTKITGKVSVSGATVKIKVGSKTYKKAAVKGKKFTLKVPKLKKKTKVVIKVTKSGYKSLSKTYKVK